MTSTVSSRRWSIRVVVSCLLALALAACGGADPPTPRYPATSLPAEAAAGAPGGAADNPFVPEGRNFGDCASSLPPPDCGSEARGGGHQLLTLSFLLLGVAFITWRVVAGVRRRDRERDREAAASSGP